MVCLSVRQMTLEETRLRIEYFYNASDEYLRMLGVDPAKLAGREAWFETYRDDYTRPIDQRRSILLIWLDGERPIGFSSADKIRFGEDAYMHLHIIDPALRAKGTGTQGVIKSATLYIEMLQLKRLFCQPNAFNVAPNRTLQKAGFSYVKSFETVPGAINFQQAVTLWVLERAN